ncbi:regulatory protein RecX [Rosettibacter firmus]|uniref:regulatory protein RecX n=1 Tax=Rosettibacter firmus TaxID=3111522 RepID=UPI00336BC66F
MIITSIKKKGNNVEIQFDEGKPILLDHRVVIDNGLRKNDVITESKKNELLHLNEKFIIKNTALKFILRRLHSVQELKNKLLKKNFNKELINEVINELISKNYLNDLEFCKAYFEERFVRKKIGINKIKLELLKKGVEKKIIDEVINEADENASLNNAYEVAIKKLRLIQHKKLDKQKKQQKLYSFLVSKGFQTDIILKVLKKLNLDEEAL